MSRFQTHASQPIQLATFDNSWYHPGGSLLKRTAWFFLGQPLVRSAWIPSSAMRVFLLRAVRPQL